MINKTKQGLSAVDERVEMISEVTKEYDNVKIDQQARPAGRLSAGSGDLDERAGDTGQAQLEVIVFATTDRVCSRVSTAILGLESGPLFVRADRTHRPEVIRTEEGRGGAVGGHPDLASGGKEEGAMTITECDQVR